MILVKNTEMDNWWKRTACEVCSCSRGVQSRGLFPGQFVGGLRGGRRWKRQWL